MVEGYSIRSTVRMMGVPKNLTMRMGMRRFTRLTNASSRKVENLTAAESLHFM